MTNWCSQLLQCFQNCMHYSLETGKYRSWALGCFCRKESCSYSFPASCSWGASLSLAAKPLLQLSPFNYLLFHAKSLKKASLHGGLCGRDSWALLCMGQQLSWALEGWAKSKYTDPGNILARRAKESSSEDSSQKFSFEILLLFF